MELQLQFDSAQSLDDMNLFIFPEMPGSITPFHLFGWPISWGKRVQEKGASREFLDTHFKILESFLHLEEVGACLVSSINIVRGRNSNRDTFVLNCLDNISELFEVIQPTEMGKNG